MTHRQWYWILLAFAGMTLMPVTSRAQVDTTARIAENTDDFWYAKEGDWTYRVQFRGREAGLRIVTAMYGPGPRRMLVIASNAALGAVVREAFAEVPIAGLEPIKRVKLSFAEAPDASGRSGFSLSVGSVEEYGTNSYGILGSLWHRGDTLHLALLGIMQTYSIGGAAMTPARASYALTLAPGRHVLEVAYGHTVDRIAIDVTDSSTSLHSIDSSFTAVDARVRRRRSS